MENEPGACCCGLLGLHRSIFKEREMLVLARKRGEKILINGGSENGWVTITVIETTSERCKIGVEAGRDIPVHRQEVWIKIQEEGRAA